MASKQSTPGTIARKLLRAVIALVGVVALIGMIKFNLLDDDLYVQNAEGQWIRLDTLTNKP